MSGGIARVAPPRCLGPVPRWVDPDALAGFLRAESARVFDWTAANCLLMPADWAVDQGLADPAAPWRTACVDQASARGLVANGVLALAIEAMARVSARPVSLPLRGDVGVATVIGPDGPSLVGAICTGGRWAVRAERGLWIGRAVPVAVWRLSGEG